MTRLWLHTTRYATGGLGERSTAPPVADEAVRSSNEAQSGDSACVPATLPNCGWLRCLFNLAAPNPLWYFLRGESTTIHAPLPCQGHNYLQRSSVFRREPHPLRRSATTPSPKGKAKKTFTKSMSSSLARGRYPSNRPSPCGILRPSLGTHHSSKVAPAVR